MKKFLFIPLIFSLFACSGKDGADGIYGADGTDGASCEVTADEDAYVEITCGAGEPVRIPKGSDGTDGTICEIVPLADAPNDFEIFCDGESVGYLNNGENGIDGLDGTNCDVAEDGAYFAMNCGGEEKARWAKAMCLEKAYNPEEYICDRGILFGSVEYEGQIYKTVVIGEQIWMAENLNYELPSGSKCYDEDPANCETYGRLYSWAVAMNLPESCNTSLCADKIDEPHRGICPEGWHIPSDEEWGVLVEYAGGSSTAGTKLKSSTGWNPHDGVPTGTDNFGFSALPGGYGGSGGDFYNVGNLGYWWSASEFGYYYAYLRGMNYSYQSVGRYYSSYFKTQLQGVRCLRD